MKFTIPAPFAPDVPFVQMHVWQWAQSQTDRNNVTIHSYLASLGFVIGTDKLDEGDYKTLDYAIDAFHRAAPRIPGLHSFADLFEPAEDGFYIREGKPGVWKPRQLVIDALVNAGWIYDVTPDSTYFEIIGSKVWAKYQQIIGSRPVAELAPAEELDFTRIRNDSNGNGRLVVHFLQLNTREELDKSGPDWISIQDKYRLALNRAHQIGGRKFSNKQYAGGIVFQGDRAELVREISRVTGREFV